MLIHAVVSHKVLYQFSWNWLSPTSSYWCTSCCKCVASFSLRSRLRFQRIAAWLQRRHLLPPHRWWGPLLLHTHRCNFRWRWDSSSILLPLLLVLILLHWLRWDHRHQFRWVDCTYTRCRIWCYNTPTQVWWRWGFHWCFLPQSGRILQPLRFPRVFTPGCLCLISWFHQLYEGFSPSERWLLLGRIWPCQWN